MPTSSWLPGEIFYFHELTRGREAHWFSCQNGRQRRTDRILFLVLWRWKNSRCLENASGLYSLSWWWLQMTGWGFNVGTFLGTWALFTTLMWATEGSTRICIIWMGTWEVKLVPSEMKMLPKTEKYYLANTLPSKVFFPFLYSPPLFVPFLSSLHS